MTNLIPERRMDRNNRIVTRWVKAGPNGTSHMRLPAPVAQVTTNMTTKQAIDGLYGFAFREVNGALCDIYEMEMPEPTTAYVNCAAGLSSLPQDALASLTNAMHKADSPSAREIVANLVYHLSDYSVEEKQQLSLLALHSESIVELMDTRCQHVYEAEPFNLINNVVSAALKRPMNEVSIEDQTEAALTLGIMFPCEYFHDNHKLVRSMIDQREQILEHHERIIDSADHIRQRNEIDVELLLDMDKYFGALRTGTL
jgi:hypothetical protein